MKKYHNYTITHYVGILRGCDRAVVVQYSPHTRPDMYEHFFGPYEIKWNAERVKNNWNMRVKNGATPSLSGKGAIKYE